MCIAHVSDIYQYILPGIESMLLLLLQFAHIDELSTPIEHPNELGIGGRRRVLIELETLRLLKLQLRFANLATAEFLRTCFRSVNSRQLVLDVLIVEVDRVVEGLLRALERTDEAGSCGLFGSLHLLVHFVLIQKLLPLNQFLIFRFSMLEKNCLLWQ